MNLPKGIMITWNGESEIKPLTYVETIFGFHVPCILPTKFCMLCRRLQFCKLGFKLAYAFGVRWKWVI